MDHEITPELIRHRKRTALLVFGSLLVLTVLTVAVAQVHLGHGANIALALTIATLKASLVLAFFMHFLWEKTWVHSVVGISLFLFVALIGLVLWTYMDPIGVATNVP